MSFSLKRRTVAAFNCVEFNPSTLARRLNFRLNPSSTNYSSKPSYNWMVQAILIIRPSHPSYTSSVRLRFIRRTNDETKYCRTV